MFLVGEPLCDVGTPSCLRPNNFNQGRLMKIEWLVVNVTAVGSPDAANQAILGIIWAGRFFAIKCRPYLWTASYFVM